MVVPIRARRVASAKRMVAPCAGEVGRTVAAIFEATARPGNGMSPNGAPPFPFVPAPPRSPRNRSPLPGPLLFRATSPGCAPEPGLSGDVESWGETRREEADP